LHKGTLIPIACKREGQHFGPEQTQDKNNAPKKVFCHIQYEALNVLKNPHKYQEHWKSDFDTGLQTSAGCFQ
jgi:hypothetical protein